MKKYDKLWHGGKGDNPRPVDKDKYADGWERIFGNKDDIDWEVPKDYAEEEDVYSHP
jgi:hypothetical protein